MKKKCNIINLKNQITYIVLLGICGIIPVGASAQVVFAADGDVNFDGFITFICGWLVKIGAVVAMIGGVQMAIGFKQDDPDAKVRGLQTLAAGFMVAAIGAAPSLFGIV